MSQIYEANIYLAILAEQSNRFDDIDEFLKDKLKTSETDFNPEVRNLFKIACKNTVSSKILAI
jgi:hypothetical protein